MSSPFYSSSVPQPLSRPSPVSAFDIITAHPPQASTSTLQASRETTSASGSQPDSPYYCSPSTLPYSPRSITSANAPSNSRVSGNDSSGMQVTEGEPRMVKHETERRLRPFACGIDNCRRRYRSLKRLKRHYQHSGDHGAIGLQLLALGQHECLQHKTAAETCQTTRAHSATTSRSSRSPSKSVALQSRPSTTPEHPPASPPDPSDRVRKISTDDPQRVINHVTSVPSSLPQERVSTPQSYPSRIQPPSDKLHPTLSSWLKNIKKLDDLINRLQGLASFSPAEHRSQLLHKVAALRAKFRRQQGRFIEFLQLSEEYANKYLFDISTEIQHQRTVLDNLDERLKAAKKLHKEAVDLQMLYESRTVATMKDLRATGLSRPLPEDNALFSEVDLMLAEIGRSYEELNKFWLEEIRRVVDATELCRIDPRDFEHWINFYSSLKRTIKFWKNRPISGDAQTPHSNYTSSSIGIDLGAIVSSLSPTINSLEEALDRISSSASLQYSQLGRTFQEVYVAFAGNRDLCLSFLRNCVNYGEKMFTWRLASNTSPTSFRARALHDLQTWTTGLRSDATGVSAENAASAQGPPRRFKITYNKALILEQKTTSGLNTLLEIFLSLAAVADGPSEDVIPDMYKIEWAWKKVTDSVRAAQVTLTIEPAQRAASMRAGSRFMFRMKSLVCFP